METVNTHKPPNRTLVVIDGGMNAKAYVQILPTTQKPKLLEQVRQAIRTRHYSQMTEKAYVHWIKRFIFFHNKRHPVDMAETEIAQFLSSLATRGRVSASTQNQAFNALLFQGVVRASRPLRLPVVLTKEEVTQVLRYIDGTPRLMTLLLYGGGLRLMECCRLRVKDIDFSRNQSLFVPAKATKIDTLCFRQP